MKKFAILALLPLLGYAQDGQACGARRTHRRCQHAAAVQPAYPAQPVVYAQPTYAYAQPQAAPQPEIQQAAATVATPAYTYQPALENRPAYYYSYDSSGKLIVTQWMDWLFRGGRDAGVPRPPLPVIGLLRNNNSN